jgi:hypothetical protein
MAPKFKIQAHVFYYTIAVTGLTGMAMAYSKAFGKSDEEKIAELEYKYADRLKDRGQKRKELQVFFDKMKNKAQDGTEDAELEAKMDEVLRAGKKKVKTEIENADMKKGQK